LWNNNIKIHTTMITLITLLISLLGYGSPADYSNMSEAELNHQIELAQENDGGGTSEWEMSLTND